MERIVAYIGDTIQLADPAVGVWPFDQLANAVVKTAIARRTKPAAPAAAPAVAKDPVYARALAAGAIVHQALVNAGLGEPGATFGTYASYHETGAFTSPLFIQHNNGSGIKYVRQKGAVKGANGYAWFNSIQDWAAAYRHELTKGSNPAGAKTVEDFARRLKANRYYEDSYDNYLHGITRARLVLSAIPAAEMNYDMAKDYNPETGISTDKPTADKFTAWWDGLSTIEKVGGGVAVFTGILLLTRR